MKYILLVIFISIQSFTYSQNIFGGDMEYGLVGSNSEGSFYYYITVIFTTPCGSRNEFRFRNLQEQHFAIYKGLDKNNVELVNEYLVGGSILPVSKKLEIPPISNSCKNVSEEPDCVEIVFFNFAPNLPLINENYYLVYEGSTRNTDFVNVIIDPQEHFVESAIIHQLAQQRIVDADFTILDNPQAIFNNNSWEDTRFCVKDTSTIDFSFPRHTDSSFTYEYNLYTPITDWETERPVIYNTGYSAEEPLGDNYLEFLENGLLKVFIKDAGKYLIGICAITYSNGIEIDKNCVEMTLQVYDCTPKVVAALAEAEQINEDEYLVRSCDTNIPLFGRNEGGLSSGSFEWTFQDKNGENIRDFNRNPTIQFPAEGTYQGQLQVEVEGCTDSVQIQVMIGDVPESGLQEVYEVCELPLLLEGNADVDFLWEDGSTNNQYEVLNSGMYALTVMGNCERSQTIEVINIEESLPDYGLIVARDTTICLQNEFTLSLQRDDVVEIYWNGEATNTLNIQESGLYSVQAITESGCELSDEIQVEVLDCSAKLYIPTAFSPNKDGINDRFEIGATQASIEKIQIFNRWGALLYEGTVAWNGEVNGQVAAEGLYVYVIEYSESLLGTRKRQSGEVILVR